jgi:hypothetical protein
MYCHPVCQSTYGRQITGYCGNLERYDSQKSSKSKFLNAEWAEQMEQSHPMYGIWMSDQLVVPDSLVTKDTLYIDNFKFVSGLRMDNRFFKFAFQYSNAILGLAPTNRFDFNK